MADVAKRLAGPVSLTTVSAIMYTVPSNTTAIIRSIHVSNTNTSTAYSFSMAINAAAGTGANQFFSTHFVPPSGVVDWSGFLVLNAGETLTVLSSGSAILTAVTCGVEVS